jgi:hypothetical protein
MESFSGGRKQHYEFAHEVLPRVFFRSPAAFVTALAKSGDQHLREMWGRLGERLPAEERTEPQGLRCHTMPLGPGGALVIVALPEPTATPEAYFVALYHDATPRGGTASRCFTLERGADLDDTPRTVFCEWTEDRRHHNMGDGPEPIVEAFSLMVEQTVRQGTRPREFN